MQQGCTRLAAKHCPQHPQNQYRKVAKTAPKIMQPKLHQNAEKNWPQTPAESVPESSKNYTKTTAKTVPKSSQNCTRNAAQTTPECSKKLPSNNRSRISTGKQ